MRQTIPMSVIRDLAETVPGFAERIIVRKVHRTPSTPKQSTVRKGLVMPFASLLRGSMSRDVGTPPPPVQLAPAPTVKPFTAPSTPAPSVGKPTRQAFNTPKTPIPSKGNPVEFASLRAAIDSALHEQRQREESERFNAGRSAFARLAPTKKSDVQGGGLGSAHALRNLGGRLAASILNSTSRKDETRLPTNTGFRAVSGASLKG